MYIRLKRNKNKIYKVVAKDLGSQFVLVLIGDEINEYGEGWKHKSDIDINSDFTKMEDLSIYNGKYLWYYTPEEFTIVELEKKKRKKLIIP